MHSLFTLIWKDFAVTVAICASCRCQRCFDHLQLSFGFAKAIPVFQHPNCLRKSSKSWGSIEKAGENVKARAREAVGYPEDPEDPAPSWHARYQKVIS